jgi:hypothetical protein
LKERSKRRGGGNYEELRKTIWKQRLQEATVYRNMGVTPFSGSNTGHLIGL